MGDKTGIQWTDATWNPVTGCDKVSPGCAHCYAEEVALRFWPTQYERIPMLNGESRPREFEDVQCHEDRLDQPLRWMRRRMVFVNSMSDLFHEAVPAAFIGEVFGVMAMAQKHTFQILTKRPGRMKALLNDPEFQHAIENSAAVRRFDKSWDWPLPNVWLGVSAENQRFADARVPLLLATPAAVRFVSYEPALGPVALINYLFPSRKGGIDGDDKLNWIIVGGESGKDARPFHQDWARSIVAQCRSAGVPVFVKQMGAHCVTDDEPHRLFYNDRKGADITEWPADLRVREFPDVARLDGSR